MILYISFNQASSIWNFSLFLIDLGNGRGGESIYGGYFSGVFDIIKVLSPISNVFLVWYIFFFSLNICCYKVVVRYWIINKVPIIIKFKSLCCIYTGQIAQVIRRSLLVRELWGSNPELIKSPTCCQRLATVATLIVWALVQSRGDGRHPLVTPEKGIKRV